MKSGHRSKKLGRSQTGRAVWLRRDMYLGREFEEMCAQMYYRGKMFGEPLARLRPALHAAWGGPGPRSGLSPAAALDSNPDVFDDEQCAT